MTSSLKLTFDLAKRRAIFVSAHKLAVYHWHKGDLASSYLFDINDEGKTYFERYLSETPKIPIYLLLDIFEEEFKRDTSPHVYGSDRASIIERKKARLFRDTPYYYYTVQGRETEGRKDDQILLSAVTNPKLITPWIELLEKYQIPLVGINSVPIMTVDMIKLLPDAGDNNLIVSIQSISGLRQTFIGNNQLRVSRLVQLPRYGTEPYGPHIKDEVEKIKRYLNSVRLISSDSSGDNSLNTYFLLGGELLEDMKNEYKDSFEEGMHFLDINALLSKSGSSHQVSSPFSDQLYIHQLLKLKPKNTYALPRERRYNSMRNMRIGMLALSAIMIISSVLWSGYTFMQGVEFRQNTLAAQNKTNFYDVRYKIAREGLPQTPVEAADLKIAVELVDNLQSFKTTPLELIKLISVAMNAYSTVQISGFQWTSGADPNVNVATGRSTNNQGVIGFSNVNVAENQYNYYQIASLEAEINPFDGNFRRAISLINEYVETLRNQADVYDVSIISLPLDVSSEANMSGNTAATEREAKFSIRIVLGINNEYK
ncbi:MAG: hypothetical protein ACI9XC_000007 [Gammaproteobacteria bacterium]|jgi:hypothetical protein